MRQEILFPAMPQPSYRVMNSLAVNICTAMIFVDYACHGGETPTEWPYSVARSMSGTEQTFLNSVRSILAHGWVLREFILKSVPESHLLHKEWPAFYEWLTHLDDHSLLKVVDEGIVSGLDYYHRNMKPISEVEEYLQKLGTTVPDLTMLQRPEIREVGVRALLVSWGINPPDTLVTEILTPVIFRQRISTVMSAIWNHGFQQAWSDHMSALSDLCDGLNKQKLPPMSLHELVIRITGLEPTQDALQQLDRSNEIVFIPCLNLGAFLSIFSIQSTSYVLFDPSHRMETHIETSLTHNSCKQTDHPDMVHKLEVLGDAVRIDILALVKRNPNIHAQAISEILGVHQSTISRHCQQLEQSGLVHVHREGNLKRYSLNAGVIRQVSDWLANYLG